MKKKKQHFENMGRIKRNLKARGGIERILLCKNLKTCKYSGIIWGLITEKRKGHVKECEFFLVEEKGPLKILGQEGDRNRDVI